MRKKFLGLAGGVCAVFLMAFMVTTIPVKQAGPFYFSQTPFDSATALGLGGHVSIYLQATADSARIGSIVYLSSANTVKKSATITNYNAIAGVVVGGTRTSMQASTTVADTGTLAATPGQRVLVLDRGRTWVLADTQAGFSPGIQVLPSIKSGMAGRLNARTTIIDSLNRIFGKTVDTTVLGKAVLVDIRVR